MKNDSQPASLLHKLMTINCESIYFAWPIDFNIMNNIIIL